METAFDTGPLAGLLKASTKASFGVDAREQAVELTPAGGGSLPAELRKGLALYLSLDGGEAATDNGGKGDRPKVYGAKHISSGKMGGAYEFDGFDDFIECGEIDIGPENTRALWFKPNSLSVSNPYLFDTGEGNNNWIELFDHDDDGKFEVRAGAGEVTYADGKFEIMEEGRWYFVAVTVDSAGQLTIYLNGDYDSSGSVTPGTPGSVRIGRSAGDEAGAGESFFDGVIDEVMVLNRSLTAKQIKQLYDSQK